MKTDTLKKISLEDIPVGGICIAGIDKHLCKGYAFQEYIREESLL